MAYRKEDVQWHSDGYRPSRPAVNVKHWPDFDKDIDWEDFDGPDFKTWAQAELEKDDTTPWEVAAESCWEMVQSDAVDIFGSHVKVWSQGRSGGWAVVDGLKDFESWDAIDLAAWHKFERWAQSTSRDMAYQMVSFLYFNRWDDYREAVSADGLAAI